MLIVQIRRLVITPHGTFGRLSVDNRSWLTVERRPDGPNPCIPAGEYPLVMDRYYNGGYNAYEIRAVPGRDRILIHAANRAAELLGCVAPGRSIGFVADELAVLDSRAALAEFMAALGGEKSCRITVVDPRG